MSRISVIEADHKPTEFESYVYNINIYHDENTVNPNYYLGFHKGSTDDIINMKYWHSSKNADLISALENAHKIVFEILDYGTVTEMQTLEHVKLKEVDAINNSSYYNKSNGGGKGVKAPTGHKNVHDMISKIESRAYPINLHTKKELKKLLAMKSYVQVRTEITDQEHVKRLKNMMMNTTVDEFDPIVLLMPKDDSELPIIIGGNHSCYAVKDVHSMPGLMAHEIPYEEWGNMSESDLRLFGIHLNPRDRKPRRETDIPDFVQWAVSLIEEKKLFKNKNNLFKNDEKPIPWTDHEDIVSEQNVIGFTPQERGSITKKINEVFNNEWMKLKFGQNYINWGESSLANNPALRLWLDNLKKSKKDIKPYDEIFKISAGNHIWSQIEKTFFTHGKIPNTNNFYVSDHPEKILLLIYFPVMGYNLSAKWKIAYANWQYAYEKSYRHMVEIDVEFLPMTTDDLILPQII